MPKDPPAKPTFFPTPTAFRAWLEKHHETALELLVGFYKRDSGKASITWPESVDEALCFGWIDGIRRSLGPEAYSIRFTPRRATSIWSRINVDNVERLRKARRMRPAGLRAYALRTDANTGVYSFERFAAAKLTKTEERALRSNRKAAAFFDRQPPWYRRVTIHWVTSAKREDTRARRLAALIANSAIGQRVGPATPSRAARA
jgi:uncharacterized protein YdeI (YjbR/CyaY-like superfamily)